jgi:hypothetical protein
MAASGVFGWRFTSTAGEGWADQGPLPNTIFLGFDGLKCWFLALLSTDEQKLTMRLILGWEPRCKLLTGEFVRLND